MMRIALDYDGTFTADEHLWREFVELVKKRGHSVTFVTFRKETDQNHDILADAELLGIDVVFTNFRQKATVHNADIWIDDNPRYIPTADDIKYQCETYELAYQLKHPPRR